MQKNLRTLEELLMAWNIDETNGDVLWNVQLTSNLFQSMMDTIFSNIVDKAIVIICMDNIFLFAPDETTLNENTKSSGSITGKQFVP